MQGFTRNLIEISSPAPFSYDHENELFHSGEKVFSPAELPIGFGDLAADLIDPFDNPRIDVSGQVFVQTLINPVMLPPMYDWLTSHLSDELLSETADVMRDVYRKVDPNKLTLTKEDMGGPMSFGAYVLRHSHPHFVLHTVGSCACLGVGVNGTFGEADWDEKVAEFEFHNTDTRVQEVSLLAGIGHIAFKAARG